jgi:hypothetical protein
MLTTNVIDLVRGEGEEGEGCEGEKRVRDWEEEGVRVRVRV